MSEFAPWYVIAWRLIWVIPMWFFKIGFVACLFLMFGKYYAMDVWRDS